MGTGKYTTGLQLNDISISCKCARNIIKVEFKKLLYKFTNFYTI